MDQLAQGAFVSSEGICRVKTAQAAPAQCATALSIQRVGVLKRRPAADTEKLGIQRFRRLDAAAANREPRNLAQGIATDAAGIREEKGKKGVGGGTYCR